MNESLLIEGEAVVRRMMPPENAPVSALARETGITEQTLYTWRRETKGQGLAVPGDGKNPEGWSSEDKLAVVLEKAPLSWRPKLPLFLRARI
jgi:transposase-like protein